MLFLTIHRGRGSNEFLWFAGCEAFPADWTPSTGVVLKRSFDLLIVFDKQQTVFLDVPVLFPPQVNSVSKNDAFCRCGGIGRGVSWRGEDDGGFLLSMDLVVMNDPLPGPAES